MRRLGEHLEGAGALIHRTIKLDPVDPYRRRDEVIYFAPGDAWPFGQVVVANRGLGSGVDEFESRQFVQAVSAECQLIDSPEVAVSKRSSQPRSDLLVEFANAGNSDSAQVLRLESKVSAPHADRV